MAAATWSSPSTERTPTGNLFAYLPHHDAEMRAAIMDAQRDGALVDDIAPDDLWAMLIALAGTWAEAAIVHTADSSEPGKIHNRCKRALKNAVRRAFCTEN